MRSTNFSIHLTNAKDLSAKMVNVKRAYSKKVLSLVIHCRCIINYPKLES